MESSDALILIGVGFISAGLYMYSPKAFIFWSVIFGSVCFLGGVVSELRKIGGGN